MIAACVIASEKRKDLQVSVLREILNAAWKQVPASESWFGPCPYRGAPSRKRLHSLFSSSFSSLQATVDFGTDQRVSFAPDRFLCRSTSVRASKKNVFVTGIFMACVYSTSVCASKKSLCDRHMNALWDISAKRKVGNFFN